MPLNVEIKARCEDHGAVRRALESVGARREGLDHQVDTYFRVPSGRFKLREGRIENSLIYYRRDNREGPKRSEVTLARVDPASGLGPALRAGLEVLVVVDKQREIWFADNVKLHLDDVVGLGRFVEIEAIDRDGSLGEVRLREQCEHFMDLLGIREGDLVDRSYSDLLLEISLR